MDNQGPMFHIVCQTLHRRKQHAASNTACKLLRARVIIIHTSYELGCVSPKFLVTIVVCSLHKNLPNSAPFLHSLLGLLSLHAFSRSVLAMYEYVPWCAHSWMGLYFTKQKSKRNAAEEFAQKVQRLSRDKRQANDTGGAIIYIKRPECS